VPGRLDIAGIPPCAMVDPALFCRAMWDSGCCGCGCMFSRAARDVFVNALIRGAVLKPIFVSKATTTNPSKKTKADQIAINAEMEVQHLMTHTAHSGDICAQRQKHWHTDEASQGQVPVQIRAQSVVPHPRLARRPKICDVCSYDFIVSRNCFTNPTFSWTPAVTGLHTTPGLRYCTKAHILLRQSNNHAAVVV
jgi:hypothetical protein